MRQRERRPEEVLVQTRRRGQGGSAPTPQPAGRGTSASCLTLTFLVPDEKADDGRINILISSGEQTRWFSGRSKASPRTDAKLIYRGLFISGPEGPCSVLSHRKGRKNFLSDLCAGLFPEGWGGSFVKQFLVVTFHETYCARS